MPCDFLALIPLYESWKHFFLRPSEFSWSFNCLLSPQENYLLTSTSPVRSLYLSRMTGRAGFSLRVLERSLKGCSKAEGEERLISLSPRLKLLLCDPGRREWHRDLITQLGSSRCSSLLTWPLPQMFVSSDMQNHYQCSPVCQATCWSF